MPVVEQVVVDNTKSNVDDKAQDDMNKAEDYLDAVDGLLDPVIEKAEGVLQGESEISSEEALALANELDEKRTAAQAEYDSAKDALRDAKNDLAHAKSDIETAKGMADEYERNVKAAEEIVAKAQERVDRANENLKKIDGFIDTVSDYLEMGKEATEEFLADARDNLDKSMDELNDSIKKLEETIVPDENAAPGEDDSLIATGKQFAEDAKALNEAVGEFVEAAGTAVETEVDVLKMRREYEKASKVVEKYNDPASDEYQEYTEACKRLEELKQKVVDSETGKEEKVELSTLLEIEALEDRIKAFEDLRDGANGTIGEMVAVINKLEASEMAAANKAFKAAEGEKAVDAAAKDFAEVLLKSKYGTGSNCTDVNIEWIESESPYGTPADGVNGFYVVKGKDGNDNEFVERYCYEVVQDENGKNIVNINTMQGDAKQYIMHDGEKVFIEAGENNTQKITIDDTLYNIINDGNDNYILKGEAGSANVLTVPDEIKVKVGLTNGQEKTVHYNDITEDGYIVNVIHEKEYGIGNLKQQKQTRVRLVLDENSKDGYKLQYQERTRTKQNIGSLFMPNYVYPDWDDNAWGEWKDEISLGSADVDIRFKAETKSTTTVDRIKIGDNDYCKVYYAKDDSGNEDKNKPYYYDKVDNKVTLLAVKDDEGNITYQIREDIIIKEESGSETKYSKDKFYGSNVSEYEAVLAAKEAAKQDAEDKAEVAAAILKRDYAQQDLNDVDLAVTIKTPELEILGKKVGGNEVMTGNLANVPVTLIDVLNPENILNNENAQQAIKDNIGALTDPNASESAKFNAVMNIALATGAKVSADDIAVLMLGAGQTNLEAFIDRIDFSDIIKGISNKDEEKQDGIFGWLVGGIKDKADELLGKSEAEIKRILKEAIKAALKDDADDTDYRTKLGYTDYQKGYAEAWWSAFMAKLDVIDKGMAVVEATSDVIESGKALAAATGNTIIDASDVAMNAVKVAIAGTGYGAAVIGNDALSLASTVVNKLDTFVDDLSEKVSEAEAALEKAEASLEEAKKLPNGSKQIEEAEEAYKEAYARFNSLRGDLRDARLQLRKARKLEEEALSKVKEDEGTDKPSTEDENKPTPSTGGGSTGGTGSAGGTGTTDGGAGAGGVTVTVPGFEGIDPMTITFPGAGVAGARISRGTSVAGGIEDGGAGEAGIDDGAGRILPESKIEEKKLPVVDKDIVIIKDEEVAKDAVGAEAHKMSWWWLLLVALGIGTEETYRRNKKKKAEEAAALEAELDNK